MTFIYFYLHFFFLLILLKSSGRCSYNAFENLSNIETYNDQSSIFIKESILPLITDKISLVDTRTCISIATQTIAMKTIEAFTQTSFNTITCTQNLSTLKINVGNSITDEDIREYLVRKRNKKKNKNIK